MTTQTEALKMALELLAVGTFHSPELQAKRTEVIEQGLNALAQPEQRSVSEHLEPVALEEYDAELLNDFGGGNVDWWQDYIRAELGRAYEHYQSQITTPSQPQNEVRGNLSRKPLTSYINSAGIYANDSPHIVVEKLERAIEAAHGIKE